MSAVDAAVSRDALARFAAGLAGLNGWRRMAAAAAFGGLAAFALPPAHAVPVLLVAFPGLLWLLEGVRTRAGAFAVGWFFGFGHHLLGLYWISFALFTDIGRFWWALPLSAAGLPIVLSVFAGLATLGLHMFRARGLARPVVFAACWVAAEWLRGHAFTGFPWNLTGYAWVGVPAVLQAVSAVGIYGLSLVTVLAASLPATLADAPTPRSRALAAVALGLGLFAVIGAWGAARLGAASTDAVPGVRLRLVQPAIDQSRKWAPEDREANFRRHLALSTLPAERPPTHVIWAETAAPFFLERQPERLRDIAAATPANGLTLTGVPRISVEPDGRPRYFNGLVAVDRTGAVVATYDKFHLVPFGEYMPLRDWLPVGAIAGNGAEFSPGPGPVSLALPGLPPVSPLICYEVIFPAAVTDPDARPAWILNVTNDAWYGRTAGPHQHFAIARTRAAEEGLPLVRVANSGISGVVDSHGRVTASLALGAVGVVDADLPRPLAEPTFYARWGDAGMALMLLSCLCFGFFSRQTGAEGA